MPSVHGFLIDCDLERVAFVSRSVDGKTLGRYVFDSVFAILGVEGRCGS